MNNTIEIKIECKGDAVGTLGWFNSWVNDSELVIKKCQDGTPGMFLKDNGREKPVYSFICKKTLETYSDRYRLSNDKIIYVYAVSEEYKEGLSDYPLTPACEVKAEELINKAVEQFREYWENN